MKEKEKIVWFRFQPTKETLLPIVLGLLAILFSVLMNYTDSVGLRMLLRSICQMGIVGVIIPLVYCTNDIYHNDQLFSRLL